MMDFNRDNGHGCPCKGCPDKGCGSYHDICPEYKEFRAAIDRRNEAERKHRQSNDTMSEAKRRAVWRSKRYSRQVNYNKSTKAD